jgi:hypothetical protein
MFDIQATACACFFTRCSEGINIANNRAIMAITTKSSIKVKAFRLHMMVLLFSALKKIFQTENFHQR